MTDTATYPVTPWKLYGAIEEKFPELWKVCYPRRYNEVGGARYDSPKAVARAMMDAFLGYHRTDGLRPGTTEQNEALWASTMACYGVPTYYVSHDMAVALSQTTPAEVLDCMNIKLPFDAAAFMLPTDIYTHKEYGPVSFMAYARNFIGNSRLCPHPVPRMKHDLHCATNSFTVFLRTVNGMLLHWTYSGAINMVDLHNEEEIVELQKRYSHTSRIGPPEAQSFTNADIMAMTRTIKFIFNILLLMTHKPETVEVARLVKRVNKGPEKPIEYWQPHMIGRNYKLRYEHHQTTDTHASPRGHWVSGFWREQPHGPQHSLRKTLWIEPFWRGGKI